MVSSGDFPNYSGNSDEEFVCFKVKNWQKLEENNVIKPKGEGVYRPFLTTLFLLKNSSCVGQLHIKSNISWRLWSELSRVYSNAHINDETDNDQEESEIKLDNLLVFFENDGIYIKEYGRSIDFIDIRSFYSRPSYCVKRILKYVNSDALKE